jgi:outer membrane biosynthesis protein TonB
VHSDTARKVSAAHDALKKPNDKRKFRIQLLSKLRKLKEEVEIENLEVLKENIKAKIMQQSDDFGRIRLDEVLPALAIIGGAAATAARIGSAASRTAGAAARTPKPNLKLVKGGAPAVKPPTTLPNANPPVKSPTKPPNVVPIRKPVPEPAPSPATSPAPRPATQPAPQPATSPAPRPATQPASSAAAAAAATSPAPRTAQSTAPRRPTRGARPQRRMPFPDLFGGGFQVDPEPDRYGTPPTYGQSTGRAIRYTPVFSQANRPGSYLASRLQK